MIERTKGPVTVIADHSKWEAVSNFEIAQIDRIQRLITDVTLSRIAKDILDSHNVELLVADISSD
jgi:DeoR/GlpR family transcriptional regulator of sugar metabolism